MTETPDTGSEEIAEWGTTSTGEYPEYSPDTNWPDHWVSGSGNPQETQFGDEGLVRVPSDDADEEEVHYPDGTIETRERTFLDPASFPPFEPYDGPLGVSNWVNINLPKPPPWTPRQAVAQARYQVQHHTCPHYRTYAGLCLHYSACMYGWGSSGVYDAISQWRVTPEQFCHYGDTSPPIGSLAIWGGGSAGHGHIAPVVGDRTIASNDIRRYGYIDVVPLSEISARWGEPYKGWIPPYFRYGNGSNGQRPQVSAETKTESDWSKGPVYVSKLHVGQDDSDSVRRLKYRIKHIDFIPKRLREQITDSGYYGPNLRDAVAYWQKHRPNADRHADNDGRSLTGDEANAIFGDAYTIHHDVDKQHKR